jgi:hypothetical protein
LDGYHSGFGCFFVGAMMAISPDSLRSGDLEWQKWGRV